MRPLVFLLLFFLFLGKLTAISAPPEFVRKNKVAAMRWSYAELYAFIEQMRAVTDFKPDRDHEDLEVSDGAESFHLGTGFSASDLLQAPRLGTSVRYTAVMNTGDVNQLQLLLDDDYRSVQVSGRSAERVAAVSALAEKTLGVYAHFVGSALFYWCIAILLLACIAGAVLCLRGHITRLRGITAIILWIISTGIIPNLSHLGAYRTFAIYQGDASLINRGANIFTFWGFIVGILGLAAAI